jgi:SAM-dependent methyltransferase
VERGVLRLSARDAFYDGAYHNQVAFIPRSESARHIWPLWLINSGYPWAVRKHVAPGSRVLDLGCAGGVRYFGQRYEMIGCDVSGASLEKLADVYAARIQVDAGRCIPLADGAADAIVSSYFWEHIPPATKTVLLAECARVLRPRGKLVFLYDVATDNPLIEHHRERDPALYRQSFIEGDGHLGYQSMYENRAAFERGGFRVLEHRGMEKTALQSASVYEKLARFEGAGRRPFAAARVLARPPLFYPYTALMRVLDTALAPALPDRWARIALTVCEMA